MKSRMLLSAATIAIAFTAITPGAAQTTQTGASVVQSQNDQSAGTLAAQPVILPKGSHAIFKEHRVRKLPPLPPGPKGKSGGPNIAQSTATTTLKVSAPVAFRGISDGVGYKVDAAPSDTSGAIGSTQYVQWVNEAVQIFDRNGVSQYGPTLGRSLWKGFGGACEKNNDGDPIVQYDKIANRWILSQFAVADGPPFFECIAVSLTDDATGSYFRYGYGFDAFNDYPKFGVWFDGYYVTFNMFDSDDNPIGSKICGVPKDKMLTGAAAPMQCFDVPEFGLLPADVDGNTPPPAGAPEILLAMTTNGLNLWKLHVDWNDATKSTLTGPTKIAVAPFTAACPNSSCVPQKGTPAKLDAMGDRLMYRLAYRNFGDHDSLVVTHSIDVAGSKGSALRWYEVRNPLATPTLAQQATYVPGTSGRFIGSAAMDKKGNLLVGYTASSSSMFPSIMFAGRDAGDPIGKLSKELLAVAGTKSQADVDRWGDYASMSIDPTDDCTFWFTTEVMEKNRKAWQTSIVHTKFTNCS